MLEEQESAGLTSIALPPSSWDLPFQPQPLLSTRNQLEIHPLEIHPLQHPQTGQTHLQPHSPHPRETQIQPQTHQPFAMNQHTDSGYPFDGVPQSQGFYQSQPPPDTAAPSYYHTHAQPFASPSEPSNGSARNSIYSYPETYQAASPGETPNASVSNYPYPAQYSSPRNLSPTALSPSTSADPELKRIRNTAASARFRAKKKRREQSLERNAKEKREALQKLEDRIQELEAENKFLKGLIFDKEKMDGVRDELERVKALKREMEAGEGERDDGVGTQD